VVSYVVLCKKSVKMNLVSEREREREREVAACLVGLQEREKMAGSSSSGNGGIELKTAGLFGCNCS